MPGQRLGKHLHTRVHLHIDIDILFKLRSTSYSVCKTSILAIAMINLQVYEQYFSQLPMPLLVLIVQNKESYASTNATQEFMDYLGNCHPTQQFTCT